MHFSLMPDMFRVYGNRYLGWFVKNVRSQFGYHLCIQKICLSGLPLTELVWISKWVLHDETCLYFFVNKSWSSILCWHIGCGHNSVAYCCMHSSVTSSMGMAGLKSELIVPDKFQGWLSTEIPSIVSVGLNFFLKSDCMLKCIIFSRPHSFYSHQPPSS